MLVIQVGGMSCEGCVRSVTKAIERVPGVEGVEVVLATGKVTINGPAARDAVTAAVEKAGYDVAPAPK